MTDTPPPAKNRTRTLRRLPKCTVRVTCRRGALDLGPNLALSIADISETEIGLVVKEALEPDLEVSVSLESQTDRRPTLRVGRVDWCMPTADNTYLVGVKFDKSLPYPFVLQVSRLPSATA